MRKSLPRPAGQFSNYLFPKLNRAGDRTRTGDVQLGKEAENQGLTLPTANSPLRTCCSLRRAPTLYRPNKLLRPPAAPQEALKVGPLFDRDNQPGVLACVRMSGSGSPLPRTG